MERTIADIAWCAGFYEGEGTIVYGANNKGPLRIKISSTDRDVLELMAKRSGVGGVSGPYSPKGFGKKPFFQWAANGHAAADLLRDMLPLLGERRSARVLEKVALWEQRPLRSAVDRDAMRADRVAGMTYEDIGRKHGVSHAHAYQICRDGKRAPRRWAVAPAE